MLQRQQKSLSVAAHVRAWVSVVRVCAATRARDVRQPLSLSHTHTHTHSHSLSHTLTHSHYSLTTLSHTLSHTLSLSLSHSHSHSHSRSHYSLSLLSHSTLSQCSLTVLSHSTVSQYCLTLLSHTTLTLISHYSHTSLTLSHSRSHSLLHSLSPSSLSYSLFGLRRVFQAIEQQAFLRVIAQSRRGQGRECIPIVSFFYDLRRKRRGAVSTMTSLTGKTTERETKRSSAPSSDCGRHAGDEASFRPSELYTTQRGTKTKRRNTLIPKKAHNVQNEKKNPRIQTTQLKLKRTVPHIPSFSLFSLTTSLSFTVATRPR